jgi:DNA-binding transcriptional LysR family regulator
VEANPGVAMVSSHAVEREIVAGHLGTARISDLELQRYLETISRGDKYCSPAGIRFREFVGAYLR